MYIFKKLVSRLFFPVPLCVELLLAGLILLLFTRRQRLAKALLISGTLLLLLLGYPALSGRLIAPIESAWPPLAPQGAESPELATLGPEVCIVVLGQGLSSALWLPPTGRVNDILLGRLIEAVRLHRLLPGSRIIVSLSGPAPAEEKVAFLNAFADTVGLPAQDFELIADAVDTEQEVLQAKERAGDRALIVVSDASHIPRAMRIFRRHGLDPVPAPCNYAFKPDATPGPVNPAALYPNSDGLSLAERAVYEYLGLKWERLRD